MDSHAATEQSPFSQTAQGCSRERDAVPFEWALFASLTGFGMTHFSAFHKHELQFCNCICTN